MTNQVVLQLAKDLKKASAKNDAKIWSKIAEFALKPSIARRIINLNKIDKLTKRGGCGNSSRQNLRYWKHIT